MRSEKFSTITPENTEGEDFHLKEQNAKSEHHDHAPAISRRDFLAGIVALGIRGITSGTKEVAAAEKRERGNEEIGTYENGINTLQAKSRLSNVEHAALYIRKKDGGEIWTHRASKSASSADLETPEELAALLREGAEEIQVFHTHPLALIYRDPEILKRARTGEAPLLAMPPSFMDVSGAIFTIAPLSQEMSQRIEWRVVDPVGIWEYRIDRNHSYFKKIAQSLQEVTKLSKELGRQNDMRRFIKKYGLADADPRIIVDMLEQRQKELSRFSRSLLQKLSDMDAVLSNDPAIQKILVIESERPGFRLDAPELQKLKNAYQNIGVTIHFTAHKNR